MSRWILRRRLKKTFSAGGGKQMAQSLNNRNAIFTKLIQYETGLCTDMRNFHDIVLLPIAPFVPGMSQFDGYELFVASFETFRVAADNLVRSTVETLEALKACQVCDFNFRNLLI